MKTRTCKDTAAIQVIEIGQSMVERKSVVKAIRTLSSLKDKTIRKEPQAL